MLLAIGLPIPKLEKLLVHLQWAQEGTKLGNSSFDEPNASHVVQKAKDRTWLRTLQFTKLDTKAKITKKKQQLPSELSFQLSSLQETISRERCFPFFDLLLRSLNYALLPLLLAEDTSVQQSHHPAVTPSFVAFPQVLGLSKKHAMQVPMNNHMSTYDFDMWLSIAISPQFDIKQKYLIAKCRGERPIVSAPPTPQPHANCTGQHFHPWKPPQKRWARLFQVEFSK